MRPSRSAARDRDTRVGGSPSRRPRDRRRGRGAAPRRRRRRRRRAAAAEPQGRHLRSPSAPACARPSPDRRSSSSGNHLGGVQRVSLRGGGGKRVSRAPEGGRQADRPGRGAEAAPRPASRRSATRSGNAATSPQRLTIVNAPPALGRIQAHGRRPRRRTRPTTTACRAPTVKYIFNGQPPPPTSASTSSRGTRAARSSTASSTRAPSPTRQNVAHWDGRGLDGKKAAGGFYRFSARPRVGRQRRDDERRRASSGAATSSRSRGPPHLRRRRRRPRAGHTHQGQDVLAACGLKLVAARGGPSSGGAPERRRQLRRHRRPGHRSRLRLHAPARPLAAPKGQKVRTGQQIGSRRVDRRRDRPATCTSRSGPPPAGTRAGTSSRRSRRHLKSWDRWS